MNLARFVSYDRAGKALGSAGATLVGGAITKILLTIAQHYWPWFVTDATRGAVDDVVVAMLAYVGAYLPPGDRT